jgi:hypothetical protein
MKIGLGINLFGNNYIGGMDPQAVAHYNRVTSSPNFGVIPGGLKGLNDLVKSIKSAYSTTDVTSVLTAAYDPHYLGYKLGAGTGDAATQGAATLYSLCGSSSDLTQGTTTTQPLLLTHDGTNNYWFSNGVANCNISSDNTATISGDISLEVIVKLSLNILSGTEAVILSKLASTSGFKVNYDAANDKIKFYKNASNVSSSATLTSAGITAHTTFYLKITSVASTGATKIYTSTDGVTYTQLGTDLTITSGNFLSPSNKRMGIGSDVTSWPGAGTSVTPLKGKIYTATVATSIGGTPVINFDANGYPKNSLNPTSWTSTTSETWTVSYAAGSISNINYNSALVHKSMVIGNGITASGVFLSNTTLTRSNNLTQYLAFMGFTAGQGTAGASSILDAYSGGVRLAAIEQADTVNARVYNTATQAVAKSGSTLNLLTANLLNGSTPYSTIYLDNVLKVTDTISRTITAGTGIKLLGYGNGAPTNYAPAMISTAFISKTVDSSGIQTSMYNIIKGLNNGVF